MPGESATTSRPSIHPKLGLQELDNSRVPTSTGVEPSSTPAICCMRCCFLCFSCGSWLSTDSWRLATCSSACSTRSLLSLSQASFQVLTQPQPDKGVVFCFTHGCPNNPSKLEGQGTGIPWSGAWLLSKVLCHPVGKTSCMQWCWVMMPQQSCRLRALDASAMFTRGQLCSTAYWCVMKGHQAPHSHLCQSLIFCAAAAVVSPLMGRHA